VDFEDGFADVLGVAQERAHLRGFQLGLQFVQRVLEGLQHLFGLLLGGHLDPLQHVVAGAFKVFPFLDLAAELGFLLQDRGQELRFVPGSGRGELFLDLGQAFLVPAEVKASSRNR
jgi:hypothetical protein